MHDLLPAVNAAIEFLRPIGRMDTAVIETEVRYRTAQCDDAVISAIGNWLNNANSV